MKTKISETSQVNNVFKAIHQGFPEVVQPFWTVARILRRVSMSSEIVL